MEALIAVPVTDQETPADVIEPGEEFAMRCAVMDFFGWSDRARSMMRKAGWSYRVEVE